MSTNHRPERVAEMIRETLTETLLYEVSDPRVPGMINLTRVQLTPDLSLARIFFTQSPDDEESVNDTLAMFESAHGFLRRKIAETINLKRAPELDFVWDEGAKAAERVEELLEKERELLDRNEEE